jgi:hypothetical protein
VTKPNITLNSIETPREEMDYVRVAKNVGADAIQSNFFNVLLNSPLLVLFSSFWKQLISF